MTHSTQQSGRCDPLVLVDSISKEGEPNIQYPGPPGWGFVLEVTTLYRECNNTSDCGHTNLREGSANVTSATLPSVRSDHPSLCGHLLPYIYITKKKSKVFITLNNMLGQGISYDSLQRQLTSQKVSIMQQVEEDRVLIPAEMTHNPSTV